jgi:hypothetical protein
MRIGLIVLAVFAFLVLGIGGSFVAAYNSANSQEQGIKAASDKSEVVLGQYGQKIKEMAQVPGMLASDLEAIITAANDSRYGGDGAKGVMTWIQEQNPNLDSATYETLQREIAAGRTEFANSQALLIDRVRSYETSLGSLWTGTLMSVAGFPRIDLADYAIVTTGAAAEAFDTKIDNEPIQMR